MYEMVLNVIEWDNVQNGLNSTETDLQKGGML